MPREKRYRAELANRGSESPLNIKPYVFALEFAAPSKEYAIDTVASILDGRGMIIPPVGTRFELWRLIDKTTGKVVLE
jgi:hypothetical protein